MEDEGILGGGSAPRESKLISWIRVRRGPIGRFQLVNWTIIVHRRIRSLITEHDRKAGCTLMGMSATDQSHITHQGPTATPKVYTVRMGTPSNQ